MYIHIFYTEDIKYMRKTQVRKTTLNRYFLKGGYFAMCSVCISSVWLLPICCTSIFLRK